MINKLMIVPIILFNMIYRFGFFKTIYFILVLIKNIFKETFSYNQPAVTRSGDYYIVEFKHKSKLCKILCRRESFIVDVMKDEDTSVKEFIEPYLFFKQVPLTPNPNTIPLDVITLSRNIKKETIYFPESIMSKV